jgi:hypothetical protein
MPRELQPGDRVRVTRSNRLPDYLSGDLGTVLWPAITGPSGTRYSTTAMDKDGPGKASAVFAAE